MAIDNAALDRTWPYRPRVVVGIERVGRELSFNDLGYACRHDPTSGVSRECRLNPRSHAALSGD